MSTSKRPGSTSQSHIKTGLRISNIVIHSGKITLFKNSPVKRGSSSLDKSNGHLFLVNLHMGKATQGASITIEELEVASRNLVAVPYIGIHKVTSATDHITDTRLLDVLRNSKEAQSQIQSTQTEPYQKA